MTEEFFQSASNGLVLGLLCVGLASICLSIGYLVKTQMMGLKLQAELIQCVGALTKTLMTERGMQAAMNVTNDWRKLPDDGRAMLRKALREVLSEMEREMN